MAVSITKALTPELVLVILILLAPKATDRTFVLFELKTKVVWSLPFKSKVPAVNVVVIVAATT